MQGEIRKTARRHAEWGDRVCTAERSRGRGRGLRRSRATIMKMKEGLNDEGNVWWRGIEGETGSGRIFSWASKQGATTAPCLNQKKKELQSFFFCMFPLLNLVLTCDALRAALLPAFYQSPLSDRPQVLPHHLTIYAARQLQDSLCWRIYQKKKLSHKQHPNQTWNGCCSEVKRFYDFVQVSAFSTELKGQNGHGLQNFVIEMI